MSHHIISPEVGGQGSQSAQGVEEHPGEAYFTKSVDQELKKLPLVGVECLRLGRHHHTQQQKSHLSGRRGEKRPWSVPALGPAFLAAMQSQYLFLWAVGTVSTVLEKMHELRPGFQAFLSKNGG